jgi:hypothetical protein
MMQARFASRLTGLTMVDPNRGVISWATSPSAKEKNAANRAVNALLDILAPEPAVRRAEKPRLRVEQHRTPGGCVLQAAGAALSVSWFPDAARDAALGEVHILVWRGTVARRGSLQGRKRAVVTQELVVRPVEHPEDDLVWRTADDRKLDTESLAALCLSLLEEQISVDQAAEAPGTPAAD